jgi:hypothetical protein
MIHELVLSHHLIGYLNTRDKDVELLQDRFPISELSRDELSQSATRNWLSDSLCQSVSLTEGPKALLATQVRESPFEFFKQLVARGLQKKSVHS